MKTINICAGQPARIVIGRRGENEATEVVFDVSALVSTYGDGTAVLLAKRPNDTTAYPVTVEQDGSTVTWTVSDTDTAYQGGGECELFWYVDDTLAKSVVYGTTIGRDIGEATDDPPDAYESWVEQLIALGAEILAHTTKGYSFTDDGEGNITISEVE